MYFQVDLLAKAYSDSVTDSYLLTPALTYNMHQDYLMSWRILEVNAYYLFESHSVSSEQD